jgi:hypothetical protein
VTATSPFVQVYLPLLVTVLIGVLGFYIRNFIENARLRRAALTAIGERIRNFNLSHVRLKSFVADGLDREKRELRFPWRYTRDDFTLIHELSGRVVVRLKSSKARQILTAFRNVWVADMVLGNLQDMCSRLYFDSTLTGDHRKYMFDLIVAETSIAELVLASVIGSEGHAVDFALPEQGPIL